MGDYRILFEKGAKQVWLSRKERDTLRTVLDFYTTECYDMDAEYLLNLFKEIDQEENTDGR